MAPEKGRKKDIIAGPNGTIRLIVLAHMQRPQRARQSTNGQQKRKRFTISNCECRLYRLETAVAISPETATRNSHLQPRCESE